MKKEFLNIVIVIVAISLFFVACDDNIDPEVTELKTERAFSPSNLEAKVLNDVNARLVWDNRDNVSSYTVEFYTDTINITEDNLYDAVSDILPENLPYTYDGLPGDTAIYARVKAISSFEGSEVSKWSSVIFETSAENVFDDPTLGGEEVTLNWTPEIKVTYFVYNEVGGVEIRRDLTAEEINAGAAVITGLTFDTKYLAKIYNGSVKRGKVDFSTLPDGVVLTKESNIVDAIAEAEDGETFILDGGVYETSQGTITIDKNVSFIAHHADNRPKLNVQFVVGDNVTGDVLISGIDFVANYANAEGDQQLDAGIQIKPADGATLGNVTVDNCTFTGHKKSLMTASDGKFSVKSVTINNCIITNLNSNGGDFIDIRTAFIETITITNNTFNNCAYNANVKPREFVRYDGSSKSNAYDDGINTPTIILENNTLYKCSIFSEEKGGRLFYVRWENTSEVISCKNNIFYEMTLVDYYTDAGKAVLKLGNNYYYKAAVLLGDDSSGTEADPVFADPDNGDFTVSNLDVVADAAGDPRWCK